ncbi:MAG TPA: nitroreductase [Steroidobacteraceae bacterium]|jgi:nitroreductase|nr:nitroreductase [Steroidobacteraceae bacterium]
MELFDAIASRSTAKALTGPGPTPQQVARLVEAAGRAPDHGRLKPWRFIAVDGALREPFANAVAQARRDQIAGFTEEQMELEREKMRRSPSILIAGCVVRKDVPKVPEIEQVIAVGAAVENLLLAAADLGFGVMWKTGPAAYNARVKAAVGLAADDHIVAILHLGTKVK